MGFEQVKAAGIYKNGAPGTLIMESFPYHGQVTTDSADSAVTDSAAAATAIATGFKVDNGVVSMAIPGDGSELETLLEYFKTPGKSTGLVTTTYITHATPACFGAHEPSRSNYPAIADDYLNQTRPNVILGGGANGMSPSSAQAAGYIVVTDTAEMLALNTETVDMVSGQFGSSALPYELDGLGSLPHLSEMTEIALEILDNDPDGFFLMVEGGLIDWACHANDLPRTISETIEFDNTVQEVLDWAQGRTDTLIIVTADHETGGLSVVANNGADEYPTVTWSTGGHTGANVPVYAGGPNAELILGAMDNTDFFTVAVTCFWDYDDYGDGDVDGYDLRKLINNFDPAELADFADEFGNICP
jgi:alkaline phosphatase